MNEALFGVAVVENSPALADYVCMHTGMSKRVHAYSPVYEYSTYNSCIFTMTMACIFRTNDPIRTCFHSKVMCNTNIMHFKGCCYW